MEQKKYMLTPVEVSVLLIAMITGLGLLKLPNTLAKVMDTPDGWISTLISGIIIMFIVYLYVRLQKNFPGENILQFIKKSTIGFWVTKLLAILFIIHFIGIIAFDVRLLALVLKMYLIDRTPSEIIVAVMLLTTTYAVTKGIQGITHLSLMFVPIVIFILAFMLVFNIPNTHIEYLLPIMGEGVLPVIGGIGLVIIHFTGIKILIFLMAYMGKNDLKALPLNLGVGFTVLIKMTVVAFSFMVFSFELTKFTIFPTIELGKEIEIIGGFVERLESVVLVIWMMTIFLTITIAQFLLEKIIKQEFLRPKKTFLLQGGVVFTVFLVAFIPDSITELIEAIIVLETFAMGLILFSLICGYLTLWFRKANNGA